MLAPVAIESVASRIEAAAARCSFDVAEQFPHAMYQAYAEERLACLADEEAVIVARVDGKTLFIWWAHTENKGIGVPERCIAELDACARLMECTMIRFHSTLQFWLVRGPELGFALRDMIFERAVP